MSKRKICVVTGSRAEYGLLYWILDELKRADDIELQLVVTGMHLAPEFGETVREIERDGFVISRRVDMLLAGDSPSATAKSVGLGVIGMSDALASLAPDIVLLLGDRFEILAAAQACLFHNVRVAHIAGGDTTEGAYDEAIRHAISKMAHLHFVTNAESGRRVRQLGEDPASIHVVGHPGLDHLRRTPLLGREDLEKALGHTLGRRNILITFHPVTLEPQDGLRQQDELLAALETLPHDVALWFTHPNADSGGRALAIRLAQWVRQREGAHLFESLGQLRYLSLMAQADMVLGNSSSGLYEAPSFGIPTVDIGNRQLGRLRASSVLHCEPERAAIARTIAEAFAADCTGTVNPYGDGDSARRIADILRHLPAGMPSLKKHFHLLETQP